MTTKQYSHLHGAKDKRIQKSFFQGENKTQGVSVLKTDCEYFCLQSCYKVPNKVKGWMNCETNIDDTIRCDQQVKVGTGHPHSDS